MKTALAYYNWGRFVAECPADGCGDAREVRPEQTTEQCANGHRFDVEWPADAARIVATLAQRPEKYRSWFPKNHPLAVRTGQPHGQSLRDLNAETEWLEQREQDAAGRAAKARAALAELGLDLDLDTGRVRGL